MGTNAFKNDSTFILFPNLMAKNKEGVYRKYGTKLKDADPESFVYLNEYYQKDKDLVFHKDTKPLDADAATFKVVGEEGFGYDKSTAYYRNKPLKSADPSTWQWIDSYYSKDHQSVYFGSGIIEDDMPDAIVFSCKANGELWQATSMGISIIGGSDIGNNITDAIHYYGLDHPNESQNKKTELMAGAILENSSTPVYFTDGGFLGEIVILILASIA